MKISCINTPEKLNNSEADTSDFIAEREEGREKKKERVVIIVTIH